MSAPLHPKTGQFRFGVIAEVDAKRARVRVRLPEQSDMLSGWLPVTSAMTSGDRVMALPRVGSQVALLTDALCEDGVCLGAIYSDPDPVPGDGTRELGLWLDDGATLRYDRETAQLSVDLQPAGGTLRLAGQALSLSGGGVEIDLSEAGLVLRGATTVRIEAPQAVTIAAPEIRLVGTTVIEGDIDI